MTSSTRIKSSGYTTNNLLNGNLRRHIAEKNLYGYLGKADYREDI
jgi:hypothetical protein